jgi:hypothetical protein
MKTAQLAGGEQITAGSAGGGFFQHYLPSVTAQLLTLNER